MTSQIASTIDRQWGCAPLIELLRTDNGQFQKQYFSLPSKGTHNKFNFISLCSVIITSYFFFLGRKCCERISYSDWTLIRGPCMNNIEVYKNKIKK